MKFTRNELIRAKDVQLHSIGLNRTSTRGWLQKALDREFTEDQINAFHYATKVKEKPIATADNNVEAVRRKLEIRARIGLRKYGVTTERGDLSKLDWLRHAQEEAMDLAVYLEVLIREEEKR